MTILCVAALAGCGGSDERDVPPAPTAAGVPTPEGGLSIQEAIDSDLEGPLMVRGYVVRQNGQLRLCDSIRESDPPQCGEPSLRIDGAESLEPSEERVSLLGEVADGSIHVSGTTLG